MPDLIVLGAGPAGVGAAFWGARAGHEVTLIERAPAPGGAAGSFEVGGMRVDHGSHRLHPSIDPSILADVRELLGDELQLRKRNGRIRLAGRWVGFPLRIGDLVRKLPPTFTVGVARDASTRPFRKARRDTFAEVLAASLGPTICERFYFPYARKLWGLEPDEIAGEQARRRVGARSFGRLVAKLLRPSEAGNAFYYPRRGFGSIWEALAEGAEKAGAETHFGSAAVSVEILRQRVRVVLDDGAAVLAPTVFSTLPITVLARVVEPPAPKDVRAAARSLGFRSMVLVYLVLNTDRYTKFDAHYLPEPYTPVTRISEPKNYRDGPDPIGRTVLCAEIPCGSQDAVWTETDEALGEIVLAALAGSGLPRPRVRSVEVRRLPHAYPIYRSGFEDTFEVLDRWATGLEGVVTLGRQGLFAHDNSHHALAMARAAVDALGPNGGFDYGKWAEARQVFRSHVVED